MNTLNTLVAPIYQVVSARWHDPRWRLAAPLACGEIRIDAMIVIEGTTYCYSLVLFTLEIIVLALLLNTSTANEATNLPHLPSHVYIYT